MPTAGNDIQAQPAVISSGSSEAAIGPPSHDPPPPPSPPAPRITLDQPIVATSHRLLAPANRPTVTQLASGGPFVAASGSTPAGAARTLRPPPLGRRAQPPGPSVSKAAGLPHTGPAVVAVSAAIVGVFIGSQEATSHHPGMKSPMSSEEPVGPSGLAGASISPTPFGPNWLGQSGATLLFGSAPFSSSGGSSAPLLGLNAMLAGMTLLAGMAWRRRSWDLPALQGESALLASAPDRPG